MVIVLKTTSHFLLKSFKRVLQTPENQISIIINRKNIIVVFLFVKSTGVILNYYI
jgi:hypothetical protein